MGTTNLLTILAGCYTVLMSYISSVATIFVTWTSLGAILGAAAALFGIAKGWHEWRLRISEAREQHRLRERQDQREEEAHQVRMKLLRGDDNG